MMKLLFLLFAPLPAFTGFSLGYAIRHPNAPDRADAMIMSGVFAALWFLSVHFGLRWRRTASEPMKPVILMVLYGSAALGVILFAMAVSGVLA